MKSSVRQRTNLADGRVERADDGVGVGVDRTGPASKVIEEGRNLDSGLDSHVGIVEGRKRVVAGVAVGASPYR